jgi:hypothetical protein
LFRGHPSFYGAFPVFFRFLSKQIYLFRLFRLFRNGLKIPKRTETNRNKNCLVSQNKPKINRNRFSFGLFRFEAKIFFVCFENTLGQTLCKFLPYIWPDILLIFTINVVRHCANYYHTCGQTLCQLLPYMWSDIVPIITIHVVIHCAN